MAANCYRWKFELDEFSRYPNGSLVPKHHPEVYVVDHYQISGNSVWLCVPDELLPLLPYGDYLAVCIWILSQICLCVSIVLYLCLRSKSADCKPVVCHMLSMATVYLIGTVNQFSRSFPLPVCETISHIALTSFMSQLFWLNVIAYGIWKQLYNLRYHPARSTQVHAKNFLYQSLYGWGIPVLLSSCVVVLNSLDLHIAKGYDPTLCLTSGFKYAFENYFMYTLNAVLVLVNWVFVVWTTINIFSVKKQDRHNKFVSAVHQQLFAVCVKLVVISGVSWLINLIGWMVFPYTKIYVRAVTEIICGFQGVALFIVYVLNGSMIKAIKQHFSTK